MNFIGEFQILRFSPRTRHLDVFATAMPVMALGIRKAGGFLAATAKGIATWDIERKTFEPVAIRWLVGRVFVLTMRPPISKADFGWVRSMMPIPRGRTVSYSAFKATVLAS